MAIKYYCDECGKELKKTRSSFTKEGEKYSIILQIGKKLSTYPYTGAGVAGDVDLCPSCRLEIVKELLNA